jgi:type III secretion protein V
MKISWLRALPLRADVALALALITIIVVLVVPLPPWALDGLIVGSFVMALGLLLLATRIRSQLQLLTFPALLLVSTLYRLSLNVASTKLILIEGEAGAVIEAVGRAVVGGNLIAGLCVFFIVALVQFLVVAKGAERVAEVAARFSLDAMPGKQMAIDADLRAGAVSLEQVRRRRESLEVESRLFGSMDGAMKFVKGDTIAGLVIAIVNVVGGLASGVTYHGMTMGGALHHYTVLSIGDALVAQIPSLLVAIAAGLVITRVVASDTDSRSLAGHIADDLRQYPVVLLQLGLCCVALGFVPAMPTAVLWLIGAALMGAAVWVQYGQMAGQGSASRSHDDTPMPSFARTGVQEAPPLLAANQDSFDAVLVVRASRARVRRLDPGVLDTELRAARDRMRAAGHVAFPGLRLVARADDHRSGADQLELRIGGVTWASFVVPENGLSAQGFDPMRRPHDGLPGFIGIGAADASTRWRDEAVIARVVECACRQQPQSMVTLDLVHDLMVAVRRNQPKLVDEVTQNIPLPRLTQLLQQLVSDGLPLQRLPAVLDALLPMLPVNTPIDVVGEQMVSVLGPLRCAHVGDGVMRCWVIGETALPAIDPERGGAGDSAGFAELRERLTAIADASDASEINLICESRARRFLAFVVRTVDPRLRVFGFDGVPMTVRLEVLGTIELERPMPERVSSGDLDGLGRDPRSNPDREADAEGVATDPRGGVAAAVRPVADSQEVESARVIGLPRRSPRGFA